MGKVNWRRFIRKDAGGVEFSVSGAANVLPVPTPRTGTDTQILVERHAWALAEYVALREESIAAQNNQQAAMNWGLAAFSGSLVGGFALSTGRGVVSLAIQDIQLVLFGLVLPMLLLAIAMVWLGEFNRMARAGAYIRSIEDSVTREDSERSKKAGLPAVPPIGWENALAGKNPRFGPRFGRNWGGHLGAGMVLAGGQITSAIIFALYQSQYARGLLGASPVVTVYAVVAVVVASLVFELGMAYLAIKVARRDVV